MDSILSGKNSIVEGEEMFDWSEPLESVLPFFPPGPLDPYRRSASFDWREMAVVIETEEFLRLQRSLWKKMEGDPTFAHSPINLPLEEHRERTLKRTLRYSEYIPKDVNVQWNPVITSALGQYDWSTALRRTILTNFFPNAVLSLGTKGHWKYIRASRNFDVMGCVAMTEVSHGTNTKAFRTTATFDPLRQKFILHTPDFEAAKVWAANLGKTANYAYVLAQLHTPDGICHGLHGFVVPIRDAQMNPYPGVIIGDMGAKVGLNGLDNGFMVFDHYEVEMDALLDKTGKVTPDGVYVTPIKDSKKRFSASLGALSGPRIGIAQLSTVNMLNAVCIAIRYSAVRRQFGDSGDQEVPVLEYQMQQARLLPHLAAVYVYKFFTRSAMTVYIDFMLARYTSSEEDLEAGAELRGQMGAELHAISSATKSVVGWSSRDAVQECREACGGHGYLRCAGIGRLRDDGDAFLTFEGDNNVLLQQASNWLLSVWTNPDRERMAAVSPTGALGFMRNAESRLKKKFVFKSKSRDDFLQPENILKALKWLVCHMLKVTSEKVHKLQQDSYDSSSLQVKNDSQFFYARTLSIVFLEHYALDIFWTKCVSEVSSPPLRSVLTKLTLLHGLTCLEKHLGLLYEGGYFSGPKPGKVLKTQILDLCKDLKDEAVGLVDAICPPDFILNSVLGVGDGNVYQHLETAMSQTPKCFERADDWGRVSKMLKAKL